DGVLHVARALSDADGMADRLDADLVDGELAPVLGALDVGDDKRIADVHEEPFVTLAQCWRILTCVPFPLFQDARSRRRRFPPCPGRSKRATAPGRRGRRSGRAAPAEGAG